MLFKTQLATKAVTDLHITDRVVYRTNQNGLELQKLPKDCY